MDRASRARHAQIDVTERRPVDGDSRTKKDPMTLSSRFALLSLIAVAATPAVALAASPQSLYADNCSACHQVSGKGIKGAFPTLVGSPLVKGDPVPLTTTLLNGRAGMPAFKDDLTDGDLAGIITYIRGSWGNGAKPVTAAQVTTFRLKAKAAQKARGLQAH